MSLLSETLLTDLQDEYQGGESMPLGGFIVLLGTFTAGMGAGLHWLNKRERLGGAPGLQDLLLLAVANHKLAWLLANDQVTSPLRAAFTTYEGSAGMGRVEESPRGSGLQRAIGELVTCPWCTAVWTSALLTTCSYAFPRRTRVIASVLSICVASDFLHLLRSRAKGS